MLFYIMVNGLCPDYLSSLVLPTVGNKPAYSLRNASDYKYIRSNTQLYYNPFLPSVVRDWNELPHTARNAPSISAFKGSLNSTLIGVPLLYLDGKRIAQIYHSGLRMDCSSLNHHLFSKNIIDSPLCICGRPETTKHYLFDCNRFNNLHRKWCNQYLNYANQPWMLFIRSHRSARRDKWAALRHHTGVYIKG